LAIHSEIIKVYPSLHPLALLLSPPRPLALSPSRPLALSPSHPLALSPSHPLTLSPSPSPPLPPHSLFYISSLFALLSMLIPLLQDLQNPIPAPRAYQKMVIAFFLFCFVLFCFVLFCFVLFCFVLFCFVLFGLIYLVRPSH
jgi:hypothetical protein